MSAIPQGTTTEEAIRVILDHVGEIAAMPQVVYRIVELTSRTSTSARELENAISIDPGFTGKVLILANSAYYALPRKVTSIREAATFMGFKTIRQLAMTIGVFDMFVGKTDSGSIRRRTWWRHSVDAAVCAKVIAEYVPSVEPEEAYACGLLHDVGKPLMDRHSREKYDEVERLIQMGVPVLRAEQHYYGVPHDLLGGAAARMWNLPPVIVEAIESHHSRIDGDFAKQAAVTCIASEMAHRAMDGKKQQDSTGEESPTSWQWPAWAIEELGFDDERLESAYRRCQAEIAERSRMGF